MYFKITNHSNTSEICTAQFICSKIPSLTFLTQSLTAQTDTESTLHPQPLWFIFFFLFLYFLMKQSTRRLTFSSSFAPCRLAFAALLFSHFSVDVHYSIHFSCVSVCLYPRITVKKNLEQNKKKTL